MIRHGHSDDGQESDFSTQQQYLVLIIALLLQYFNVVAIFKAHRATQALWFFKAN